MSRLLLVTALVGLLAGCAGRRILSIEDGPAGDARTTVMSTMDTKNYVVWKTAKIVYWECAETAAGGLECNQTCDIKDDDGDILACQTVSGF